MKKLLILFLAIFLFSCSNSDDSTPYKPSAGGTQGTIEVVLNAQLWEGRLGQIIKENLAPMIEYYPNEEYVFDLNHSTKKGFSLSNKRQRYILQFIINNNTSIKPDINYSPGVWAEGQYLVRIIGKNQQDLYDVFMANAQEIQGYFMRKELERLEEQLIKDQNYLAKKTTKRKASTICNRA